MLEGIRKKLAEKIYRPGRTQEAWNRLHKEAGFIPLLNIDDTEARRTEIKKMLEECEDAIFESVEKQRMVVKKVFKLFFSAGDPWYRGLDDRELAEKVACFLENCTEVGYMDEFIPDLLEEAMQLLSLSWQAIDVTNTPMFIIESRPVVVPQLKTGTPETQLDATGLLEMQQKVEDLEQKIEEAKK